MSNNHDQVDLIYHYFEQMYRLALLVTGSANDAPKLVEKAFTVLPSAVNDPETVLLRRLLTQRAGRIRWQPGSTELQRAQLSQNQGDALLKVLSARETAERLTIALHYSRGRTADEIRTILTLPDANIVEQQLTRFRAEATIALGFAATDTSIETLEQLDRWLDGRATEQEALDLRGIVFADATMRELRDAMLQTRTLLPQALPALFAVQPPQHVLPRLLAARPTRRSSRRITRPALLGGLTLAVVLTVVAIIFGPGLFSRRTSTGVALTADMIIDNAIHRFERAPLTTGVLHEVYRIERPYQDAVLLERWYDYGTPRRLAASVRAEGEQTPVLEVRTDGQTRVQYRNGNSLNTRERLNIQLTEAEVQAAIPLLRNSFAPTNMFGDWNAKPDISSLYLTQAREANASFLGSTNYNGRSGWLLRYQTTRLPLESRNEQSQSRQVLLTIDRETYGLINVAVVSDVEGESTAVQPWRAELIEVLDSVPENQFSFTDSNNVTEQVGLRSVSVPTAPPEVFVSLSEAQRDSTTPILIPQELPDANMRGLVVNFESGEEDRYGFLYEGEFNSVFIAPEGLFEFNRESIEQEQTAGAYRYQLVRDFQSMPGGIAAEVYHPDTPDKRTVIVLFDTYATAKEQEDTLQRVIGSLATVTEDNVSQLERDLTAPPIAGGNG